MSSTIDMRMTAAENDAEIFSLLAALYNLNPDAKYVTAMRNIDIAGIADDEARAAFEKINNYALNTVTDDENDMMLDLKRDWTKLFRGVSPEYGPKAPYEGLYKNISNTNLLSELTQTYLDAGYCTYAELKNRQDYIGIQLSFLGFLGLLMINALNTENDSEFERLSNLLESFLDAHIRSWFPQFYEEAQKHVNTDYFRGVLDLTLLMTK